VLRLLIGKDIRERRGSNVSINVPLYKDTHTDPHIDAKLHKEAVQGNSAAPHANGNHAHPHENGHVHSHENGHHAQNGVSHQDKEFNIHMDAMGFGMGCCCLQVCFPPSSSLSLPLPPVLKLLQCTFQCCNISEARFFYDQLAVMSPIMVSVII
jgi:hypothetical protein